MNAVALGMGPILADAARALERHAPEEAESLVGGLERAFRTRTPYERGPTVEAALREQFPERSAATIRAIRSRCSIEPLLALERTYQRTERHSAPPEARRALTNAYVGFVFGYGYARIGQPQRARWLRAQSAAQLDRADPVHGFLSRAFEARIDQALAGAAANAPLPAALVEERHALELFLRYKADRMLQASVILEPFEELDPAADFQRVSGPIPMPANFVPLPPATRAQQAYSSAAYLRALEAGMQAGTPVACALPSVMRLVIDTFRTRTHVEATRLVSKIAEQLSTVTDAFSTNSHFCLSVVEFMELLVLGTIGHPTTRPIPEHG